MDSYMIRTVDQDRQVPTGNADDIRSALEAAWALNRHTEGMVEICDLNDEGRRVAVVVVEWVDAEKGDDDVILIPVKESRLKALRDVWEAAEGDGGRSLTAAVRDLFEGGDGTLQAINRAVGYSGRV